LNYVHKYQSFISLGLSTSDIVEILTFLFSVLF